MGGFPNFVPSYLFPKLSPVRLTYSYEPAIILRAYFFHQWSSTSSPTFFTCTPSNTKTRHRIASKLRHQTLEILTRQRLRLRVLTSNGLDVPSLSTCVLDDVVSPDLTTNPIAVPPRVVALPELRQYCIRNALSSLEISRTVCERVAPQIEKYMVEAAEVYGFGGFWVVAEIEVTKADIFDQHKARSSLGVIKLSTSLIS